MKTPVGEIIINQLGGHRFRVMTGAKRFVASNDGISFRINGKTPEDRRVNLIWIKRDPSDTYTVEAWYFMRGTATLIDSVSGVYADAMQRVFTKLTGLDTHL